MITRIDHNLPEEIKCAYRVDTSVRTLYLMLQEGRINGRRVYFSAWHENLDSPPDFSNENVIFEILFQSFLPEGRYPYIELEVEMRHRFGPPIGRGRHRVVFREGDEVIKIPCVDDGNLSNDREIRFYANSHECRARCWKDESLSSNQHLIIRMEYVTQVEDTRNLPDWIDHIDGYQVGYTKEGRLVAFDYGY